jgi:hypothetical protein
METARKPDRPHTWEPPPNPSAVESEPENQPLEIKLGKMIFYLTAALGLWFFYWFNGIQCPC